MNKEKLVPRLRFEEFESSDSWEPKIFSDNIKSIQTGTNLLGAEDNSGTPLIKMGNLQRGYFKLDKLEFLKADQMVEEQNIIHYGDFLFNTRNTLELVGKAATWTKESDKYAFNNNIARFTFNKKVNTIFFNYLYNRSDISKQIRGRATGTTSVAAVYPQSLNSIKYNLPSIVEQKKIGDFFIKIDKMIQLQQSKVNKVKDIKSAYLSEMFPKEGEKYPKKRFEGFTEPWHKNKFNEITEYITSSLSANNTLIQGRYELYDANELIGYTNSSGQKQEYVTIIKDGSGVGRVRLLPKDSNFIGTMGAIVNKEQTDIHYIYAYLQQFNFTEFITGATVPHVYYRDYGESTAYHPSYEEQVKIGKLFNNLDNQISIEEEKLTKLENLKQAYLNDMFI